MRNPLSYQATEFDCGPTALRNAVSFLYDRKDIHPEIIKFINLYSMDRYCNTGGWHGIGRVGERDVGIADRMNCPPFLSRYSNTGGWHGIGSTLSEGCNSYTSEQGQFVHHAFTDLYFKANSLFQECPAWCDPRNQYNMFIKENDKAIRNTKVNHWHQQVVQLERVRPVFLCGGNKITGRIC